MIRHAKLVDIPEILSLTSACTDHMIRNGIYQWNASYPSREAFENDIKREELFVFETPKEIIGCIAISTLMDVEYETVPWGTPNHNNVYIHRLAVHPIYQKRGIATRLMDHAEQKAREASFVAIRLDTFSKNERNQRFYEERGYSKVGEVHFPNQSSHPFYCYQLLL